MDRKLVLEEEENPLISNRRELLDLGFLGYLECVRQFHEQLNDEAAERRRAVDELEQYKDTLGSRIESGIRDRHRHLILELENLREFKAAAEEKMEEQLDECMEAGRTEDLTLMIRHFVSEVERARGLCSTAAAVSLAMSLCRILENWLMSEYSSSWIYRLRDEIKLCSRAYWLCRVGCYLPVEDSPLYDLIHAHEERANEYIITGDIFGDKQPVDPYLESIPDYVLQHVAKIPEPEDSRSWKVGKAKVWVDD